MAEINEEKMNKQELEDFLKTEKIMKNIFNSYNANAKLTKEPPFSYIDAKMVVKSPKNMRNYTIEIKESNVDLDKYPYMPLKVEKYINVMSATPDGHTPLVIYLVNDEQYFIFDLTKLDLNKVELRNWNIPVVNYTDNQKYEKQPTFFIPIEMTIYNGQMI